MVETTWQEARREPMGMETASFNCRMQLLAIVG